MNRIEQRVVKVVVGDEITDIGEAECKKLPPGRRYRYSRKCKYHLENGEIVDSEVRGLTKPKLAARAKDAVELVANTFAVKYDDTDWCITLRLVYKIGV